MKYVVLFTILVLALTSCSTLDETVEPTLDTRDGEHTMADAPPDFAYHPPAIIDTTPQDSIEIDSLLPPDTCTEYIVFSDPFITGVMQFDIVPDTPIVWYYRDDPIDLNIAFPDHEVYISGHNASLIVFGTNEYAQWQMKIWTWDGSGAKNYFSFGREREIAEIEHKRQQFNFLGALTYEQMLELMPQILSARRFGFYNSGLTCEQIESLIQILQDNCVDGTGKIMDLRHAPCMINADLIEFLENADFEILL